MPGGGGVHIFSGGLRQYGGTIKLRSSQTVASGGGLHIREGDLLQYAGDIICSNCSAKLGGCLALGTGVGWSTTTQTDIHLSGSITARGCMAEQGL